MEKVKIRLQGHEKFPLREGWISKGLSIISKEPNAFLSKNSTDIFGIGSNMVKSLRYWMKAFGLIEEKPGVGAYLTDIGKLIFENDPYIVNPFTLWIMHSNIVRNIETATTWSIFFNRCEIDSLDKEQLENVLFREVSKYASGVTFSEKSLSSDVDVLLSMYSKNKSKSDPEDKSTSPFATLGLLKNTDGKITKSQPDKRLLSENNILYELSILLNDRTSISIEDVINGDFGLSKIYNITNVTANELLDKLDALGFIRVDRTAGLDMIYPVTELETGKILSNFYTSKSRS